MYNTYEQVVDRIINLSTLIKPNKVGNQSIRRRIDELIQLALEKKKLKNDHLK